MNYSEIDDLFQENEEREDSKLKERILQKMREAQKSIQKANSDMNVLSSMIENALFIERLNHSGEL